MFNQESIVFNRKNKGRLKISKIPFGIMKSFAQKKLWAKEAGGVLLGRFICDCSDIIIDSVSTPLREDIRKRHFYYRDKEAHQTIIKKHWEESGGSCSYLGEWHTHPQHNPTPSFIDFLNWNNVMTEGSYDYNFLFFLIIGTDTLSVWEGDILQKKVLKLEISGQG